MLKPRENMVGLRGEAPLVPPYDLPTFTKALAMHEPFRQVASPNRSG